MKYIIKPFSEILVKTKPVRKKYLKRLTENINLAFKNNNIDVTARYFYDKIEANSSTNNVDKSIVHNILSKTPWIEIFLEVNGFQIIYPDKKINNNDMFSNILEKTKEYYIGLLENKTFAVRVKRYGLHDFTSTQLEKYIWWWLLEHSENSRVKLKKPDITVRIEVKNNEAYIVKNTYIWIWWYPTWSQDKVLSLLSGGFDSGVSSFAMMKRGCKVDFLFFNLWWNAHEIWVKQVAFYLNQNFSSWYKARIITIPFEETIAELLTKVNHKYRWILLKRFMLKIADRLAQEHKYYAIVKWDSLGQVSSQTLKNMFVIDKASNTLVLRPLISFNKQEIVDISKKIWTYDFACSMPEYCGVISDKPATWAKLEKVLGAEENIEEILLERAYENKKVEFVNEIISEDNEAFKIEVVNNIWKNEVLIDIRDNEKKLKNPLDINKNEFLEIPFYEINYKFEKINQDKTYLLYCDKWVLSHLHALYLKDKWFNNVKVYRKK